MSNQGNILTSKVERCVQCHRLAITHGHHPVIATTGGGVGYCEIYRNKDFFDTGVFRAEWPRALGCSLVLDRARKLRQRLFGIGQVVELMPHRFVIANLRRADNTLASW